METVQLQELATNARLDHWPPHLGVNTDAEKIDLLARELASLVETCARLEADTDQAIAEAEDLRAKNAEMSAKLRQIRVIL